MKNIRALKGGLYLVVDPMPGLEITLPKVKAALEGGVDFIQLWNHWNEGLPHEDFVTAVCGLAHRFDVPVLIHEKWEWLTRFPLDGVHFDTIQIDLEKIKREVNRPFISGVTCGNDDACIQWAIAHSLDYLSFCSMYPSATANSCELVMPALVKQTCDLNRIAVYVAGGITADKIPDLMHLGVNGIAVVSRVMNAPDPAVAASELKNSMQKKINQATL